MFHLIKNGVRSCGQSMVIVFNFNILWKYCFISNLNFFYSLRIINYITLRRHVMCEVCVRFFKFILTFWHSSFKGKKRHVFIICFWSFIDVHSFIRYGITYEVALEKCWKLKSQQICEGAPKKYATMRWAS